MAAPETNGSTQGREGYALTTEGLSDMVKDQQRGFLGAYDGPDGLARALGSHATNGLDGSQEDLDERTEKYGRNYIEPPPIKTYWELIMEGLEDNTIKALLICAAVSILLLPAEKASHRLTASVEGMAIFLTVFVVLNLQATIEYTKAKEFRRQQLELESDAEFSVVRRGEIITVSPKAIVVGDVVRVAVGDIVPADGVLLEGTDVKMDESALTGEPILVAKTAKVEDDPFVLSGTNVMTGSGKLLVVAVGINSVQGRILNAVVQGGASSGGSSSGNNESRSDETETDDVPPARDDDAGPKGTSSKGVEMTQAATDKDDEDNGTAKNGRDNNAKHLEAANSGGNLTEKLDKLAIDIGKAGLIVSFVAFLIMICVYVGMPRKNLNPPRPIQIVERILSFFLVAVTILVVAVPEGLPLAVALSLAITMGKLMQDNNRVKHMDACETMGSATTICSDKTGTLTQNKMTVMRCHFADFSVEHDAVKNLDVAAQLKKSKVSPEFLELLAQCCCLNSAPTSRATRDEATGAWKYQGNATECALLKLVALLGVDAEKMRASEDFKDPTGLCKLEWGVKAFPFSSSRKKMSWVVPRKGRPGKYRLFTKGAPTYVWSSAKDALSVDGKTVVPLDLEAADKAVTAYQKAAMRTLAIAYRDFDGVPEGGWDAALNGAGDDGNDDGAQKTFAAESGATLVAVVGIEDPLRPTVTRAIEQCNTAGVDVRMCTGDALATAVAISTQCGILRERDLVIATTTNGETNGNSTGTTEDREPKPGFAMTGAEFDESVHVVDESQPRVMRRAFDFETGDVGEMLKPPFKRDADGEKIIDQARFDAIWPKLRVLARCQPEDKLTLVRGLRRSTVFEDVATCEALRIEHGIHIFPDYQVVAVTGDGTNDAPALKAANVGFAMGLVGTDIAKQACDIILLDDNFASTVAAVKWGRNVYDSISKFCQFQLTVNIAAIFIACIGALLYGTSPLGAVQMLWVNVIMDSLASVALASEPPTEALLERAPYGKKRPMITRIMWFNMIGQAIYQLIVVLFLQFDRSLVTKSFGVGENASHPADSRDTIFIRIIFNLSADALHDQEHFVENGTVHFTIIFNTFVLMTLFNELNSRKLQTEERLAATWHEWNVFEGITRNPLFLGVVLSTLVLQWVLVEFTGLFFKVRPLTPEQWGLCILFGLGSLPMQFIVNGVILLLYRRKQALEAAEKQAAAGSGTAPGSPGTSSSSSNNNNNNKSGWGVAELRSAEDKV